MSHVLFRETFSLKYVTQMGAAGSANDLGPAPVGVRTTKDRAGNRFVETRPTAMRIELVFGAIQGRIAPAATVCARLGVQVVCAGVRRLRTLVHDHALLFGCQFVVLHTGFPADGSLRPDQG